MAIEPTIAFSQIHSLDRPDQEILFIVMVIIEMLMFRIGRFLMDIKLETKKKRLIALKDWILLLSSLVY